ncbi:MAG: Eco57I restriction-modification methylase domain-containing protein [Candidatus Hodarchaeota archaeon]
MGKNRETQKRKDLGAFYTPSNLAKLTSSNAVESFLVENINSLTNSKFSSVHEILNEGDKSIILKVNSLIRTISVLDVSTGDGQFLISILGKIKELRSVISKKFGEKEFKPHTVELEILNSNIFGIEIDSIAVSECYMNMIKNLAKSNISLVQKILKNNILQGNFLESKPQDWHNFSFKKQGFDIIIGNPPWGGKLTRDQKNYYHKLFSLECPKRNLNTFSLFVYHATELLNPYKGILAFLLPKNVARSNQYTFLRGYIVKHYKILKLSFYGLFKDVTQEFISLMAQRTDISPKDHLMLIDEKIRIPQSSYLTNLDFIFTKTYDTHSQELINIIRKNSLSLSRFLTIRRGEELSKRGGIMYCPYCLKWVQLSSRKAKITCPQCLRILNDHELLIQNIIQKEADLNHNQPILTGDDFDQFSIISNHYIDPSIDYRSKKNKQIYRPPKIVVQKIKRYPCAAFESRGYWTTQNVYNLSLTPEYREKKELLYYILAVLNSSLYRWYYEIQFNLESNYTNAISIHNLKRLLIKKPSFSDPIFIQIIDKTKKILEKKSQIDSEDINEINELILRYYDCENMAQFLIASD